MGETHTTRTMLKKMVAVLMAGAMAFGMTGAVSVSAAEAAFTEPFGGAVQYDPAQEVNNGEDIELEFWTWDYVDMFQGLIDQYQSIHPNVTITIKETPWEDYWTKLPLAINSKDTPALFAFHNNFHDNLIDFMAPYDIPVEDLQEDFLGIDAHLIDGQVRYMDLAMMTANLYYNKDLWEAAGLTDEDLPSTWDEMKEVAKKLTVKDGDQIVQAGFDYNKMFGQIGLGLSYQLGQNIFNEDGTVTLNNDAMKQVTNYFVDLYGEDAVGSEDFGLSCKETFGQGQSAMTIMWGYYYNNLMNDYPDINFGVLETPTFSENKDEVYAFNRYNGESSFGISNTASEEQQAVAQDFVKFTLANDDFLTTYSVQANCFPTKISLSDRPEIKEHPVLAALEPNIDKYVWPGTMPATVETNVQIAIEDVLYNGVSVEDALITAEETINNDLSGLNFVPVENMYKYAK